MPRQRPLSRTPLILSPSQTKFDLVYEGQVEAVIRERDIMSRIFHPFIVDFVASFQDSKFIYMVIHMIQGGELFSRVHDENADKDGLPDVQAKFYSLCIADALAYLHRLGYVFRGTILHESFMQIAT